MEGGELFRQPEEVNLELTPQSPKPGKKKVSVYRPKKKIPKDPQQESMELDDMRGMENDRFKLYMGEEADTDS